MQRVLFAVGRFVKDEHGQDLIEYGLVAVLIAIGAIVALGSLGSAVNTIFWEPIAAAI